MADTDSIPGARDTSGEAAGPRATEAFALLADETRVAILLALWERYDPEAADNAVPFSALFDAVAYDDPGNFRYHLEKLEGQFVRRASDGGGYLIRTTGLQVVRSILAGAGVADASLPPTEIAESCPFCAAPTTVAYRDGLVIHACTECGGAAPERSDVPGLLSMVPFDPAGLRDRSPDDLRAAATVAALQGTRTLFAGLCPACSGPVEARLEYCADHDPTGRCGACGAESTARARFRCGHCRNHKLAPLSGLALFHPAVVSLYDDHGISTRVRADDPESVRRVYDRMAAHEVAVVGEDPPRVAVTAAVDGDAVRVTFDETVRVVAVDR